MVKRIKKRVPKKEEPIEAAVEEVGATEEDAAPVDLSTELSQIGEDKFTQRTAGLFTWLVERRKLLLAGAAVVAAGAAVYLFSQRHSRSATEEAAAAFQAGAAPYVDAHRASAESKPADAKRGQIEKAAKEFEAAISQYGDRRVAALATLGLAGARFDLGQSDEAIKLYDDFLGRPDTDAFARSLALQGKAAAQEQKGDRAAAIETWKQVEGVDRESYGLLAGVQVGRLLEGQGKAAEARTHYEKLQKDYQAALEEMANRPLKVEIERRLASLAAQGVKPAFMGNLPKLLAFSLLTALPGCHAFSLSSFGMPGDAAPLTGPGRRLELGPLRPAWRRELTERNVYRDHLHQVGGVADDAAQGRVAVGTADGWYRCFSAADGRLIWEVEVGSGGGGRPFFSRGLLYTGTDDGRMLALDADNGRKVWSYRVQGAISREPVIAGGRLYFVDGENAIYALDAATGAWRWQYRRDLPAEFSLVGEAPPTVHGDRVYVGFSDGIFVALDAKDGGVAWTADLAPEHDRFQDVDAQAAVVGDRVFAASAAAGLAILAPADGRVIETLPITGVTALTPVDDDVLVALDSGAILRLQGRDGAVIRRTHFGEGSGAPAEPVLTGDFVLVPFSRGGLHVLDARSGRPIHHFTPGNGIHGPVTVGRDGTAWLLSDGGVLYAFRPR